MLYRLSVRTLVEYVYRSGSISSRFRAAVSFSEGTKAHNKVQNEYSGNDQSEVFLRADIPYEELVFTLEGRCDGLLFSGNGVTVEEIKSTGGELVNIEEYSYPVHWAQAQCYAYIYAMDHGLSEITVKLTYYQTVSEEQKSFLRIYSSSELQQFIIEMLEGFYPYAKWRINHIAERDDSIAKLEFPFPEYRSGQRKLAGAVYKTIEEKRSLFADAPTGIGKTISVSFPAVKSIGAGHAKRIFYLTAKTIARKAAEDAFSRMLDAGLKLKVVVITAKDKICFNRNEACSMGSCEFTEGYYDRLNNALLDLLMNEGLINRQVIEAYALKHRLCPFEFSLDAAFASDAVICDYNYIFDPRVSLKRLLEEQKRQTVLLIDEAHNLVERGRDMFSAILHKKAFLDLQRKYKGNNYAIFEVSSNINNYFIALKKQCGEEKKLVSKQLPNEILPLLEKFSEAAESVLIVNSNNDSALLEVYFQVHSFIRIAKLFDESFVTYAEATKNEVSMKLFCLDPSLHLKRMGKGFCAKVHFSATLAPLAYHTELLGGGEEDYHIAIGSPFSAEQTEVSILPLSTRYKDRPAAIKPIVDLLKEIENKETGNYLVFFPSYQFLREVQDAFMIINPKAEVLVQDTFFTEQDRETFLGSFSEGRNGLLLGFAVMGGIFSEGIDLKGDRLNGVVIIGVGLPQLSFERDIIKNYFQKYGKNGYDYAYVFPGINKVLQAGGRLIRSETDAGKIFLVDDRFLTSRYIRMLPENWRDFHVLN
ncbi:ATP-dependent DNA helicase [Peribacillus saganii]|uniref:ATP-dependent DNA helicase n=1 Tax=Peribacillus saganii TaxID=2303992 RepID=A0A372LJ98_9BACI|nr:ATP-dependent DNA helicase [Peribacillus saganii]RFU66475.1 ATP-dependent DNA helicase [Peribacillus saganii]